MKSLWITLILLALLLGGILWNHHFINTLTDRMENMLTELPSISEATCAAHIRKMNALWESQSGWVALSVPYPVIDRVSEQIAVLLAATACKDAEGFARTYALLEDALGDLRHCERNFPECLL